MRQTPKGRGEESARNGKWAVIHKRDGRWVAFVSDYGGRHVWVTSATEPGYERQVSLDSVNGNPIWSSDRDK